MRIIFLFLIFALSITPLMAEEEVFVYDDHGKRDPLMPLVSSGGVLVNYDQDYLVSDLVLEGIMIEQTGDNIAIINGNIVKENDKIGAFVVHKINVNSVVVVKGQEFFTLKIKKEDLR